METRRIFGLVIVILSFCSLSTEAVERFDPQAGEPIEIESGFVIFEGRYLSPPYEVRSDDSKTYVNDFEISAARRGPFGGRGYGMRRRNQGPTVQGAERIEQHLNDNGMLVCLSEARPLFAPVEQAVAILDILLAQIASWWAGVLYTVLIVRWATFNSMFM